MTTTRFAPSPTGVLHIGNFRTALINWLLARHNSGEFILRIDDTDQKRCKDEYTQHIYDALEWLGISWELKFHQKDRISRYDSALKHLIDIKRVYACYETPEELEIKRKTQLKAGRPPIYDRRSLYLTDKEIAGYIEQGRRPHYRFKLEEGSIAWNDKIKKDVKFLSENISDPIIVRGDSSYTYLLCSTVDDIDYNITDIVRGDDHITNTAIQIQIFQALGCNAIPNFAHLGLIKSKEGKISKRIGGFEIDYLKRNGVLPMAINSYCGTTGRSVNMALFDDMDALKREFDISLYTSNTNYFLLDDLYSLNKKLLHRLSFHEAQKYGAENEDIWNVIKGNIDSVQDIKFWEDIINIEELPEIDAPDKIILPAAISELPPELNESSWKLWTSKVIEMTGQKPKDVYMALRLALTGQAKGPNMQDIILLLGHSKVYNRIKRLIL